MKTSTSMQTIVTKLAEKHGLDLSEPGGHIRLEMKGFDRLVINVTAENVVYIAHHFDQFGDVVPDPAIIFFTRYPEWVPFEVIQVIGGYRMYGRLTPDGDHLDIFHPCHQADLAEFADIWARNIEMQGWLEDGQLRKPTPPVKPTPPDIETLMAWEADGGCAAIDGCWVEPDGICPHGSHSWLLELGMI